MNLGEIFMKTKKKGVVLTEDEKEIENGFEAGDWVASGSKYKDMIESTARSTLQERRKGARVNIRMTDHQLEMIKLEADREGIPYQTLMSSVLHKYLSGQLVDRKIVDELKKSFLSKKAG